MPNKERYLEILKQILTGHYNLVKEAKIHDEGHQKYIDGYLTAARALEVIDYNELKEFIEQVHFEVFGMLIEERRAKFKTKSCSELSDFIDIPTFIRQGIKLEF